MSLLSLKYFLIVAERLNITEAAKILYISQQTLSAHIIQLERTYGVRLFNRHPKLALTPAGERMLLYAARIVQLERMMDAEMHDLSQKNTGTLIVGFSRLRARNYFPRIWEEYQTVCPNTNVTLVDAVRDSDLSHALRNHSVDLSLNFTPIASEYLTQIELSREKLYFTINRSLFHSHFGDNAPAFLQRFSSEGIGPEDALGLPLILLPSTNIVRKKINSFFDRIDVIPSPVFESTDSDMILDMCIGGKYCSVMMLCNLFADSDSTRKKLSDLYFFPLKDVQLQMYITYLSNMQLPEYFQKFIDVCFSTVSNLNEAMLLESHRIITSWSN